MAESDIAALINALDPNGAEAEPWDEPTRLIEYPMPDVPLEVLPEALGRMAAGIAASKQVTPDMAVMHVLGAANLPLSGRLVVRRTADHLEPIGLFLVTTAGPSEGKNQSQAAAMDPVHGEQRRIIDETGVHV